MHAVAGSIVDIDVVDMVAGQALITLASGAARLLDLNTGLLTTLRDSGAARGTGAVGLADGAAVATPTRALIVDHTVEIYTGATRMHELTSVPWTHAEALGGRRVIATASFEPMLVFADGGVQSFAGAGTVVALARGADTIYVAGSSGVVRVNASSGVANTVLSGLSPSLHAFALNAAENRLAGAQDTFNGNVIVYELPVGDPFRTLTGHLGRVYDVAFAGDNVVTACNDGDVRVFALSTGALVGTAGFTSAAIPYALDANVSGAVAGAIGGEVLLVDVAEGAVTADLDLVCSLNDVALSFDGSLAAVSCDDRIVLIDVARGAPRGEIAIASSAVRFAPDELLLLAVDEVGWTTFVLTP